MVRTKSAQLGGSLRSVTGSELPPVAMNLE